MDHIEYRTETEAPTTEGWYWGKLPRWTQPMPLEIVIVDGELEAMDEGCSESIHDFRWFGPVTMVKESGAE